MVVTVKSGANNPGLIPTFASVFTGFTSSDIKSSCITGSSIAASLSGVNFDVVFVSGVLHAARSKTPIKDKMINNLFLIAEIE